MDLIACHLQHVADAIQNNVDHLCVLTIQKIAERWDHTFLDQLCHLPCGATDSQVADCPCCLLLCLELTLPTQITYNSKLVSGNFF